MDIRPSRNQKSMGKNTDNLWGESLLSHAWNSFLHVSPREMSNNVPSDEDRLRRRID